MFTNICSHDIIINMKRNDVILIAILLIISVGWIVLLALGRKSGDNVLIYSDGVLYGRYSIHDYNDITIESDDGAYNRIIVDNNEVYMMDANCPDKVCINQGNISKGNDTICCAPNGIVIVIESNIEGEYDAITQ